VIYLFSKPVSRMDLSFSGRECAIANGTLVLQLKLAGKAPELSRGGDDASFGT
jgi:hypothetical protein